MRAGPRRRADHAGRAVARLAGALAPSLLLLLLAACAAAVPTKLYTLAPATLAPAEEAPRSLPLLGLGPVSLPEYLDRAEIVTRAGAHGVRLGEFDRWAEPLEPQFLRLLAEGLRRETGGREIVPLPARGDAEPALAVEVDVDRFDAGEDGEVLLDARWRVRQADGGRSVGAGRSLIRERGAPAPPAYDAVVAAMSRAVDGLAREIAAAVPAAPRPRGR